MLQVDLLGLLLPVHSVAIGWLGLAVAKLSHWSQFFSSASLRELALAGLALDLSALPVHKGGGLINCTWPTCT